MADPLAGDRLVASGAKHPFIVSAAASASLTLAAAAADVVGASVTFNTVQAAATVVVWGVFDVSVSVSAVVVALGLCSVDGVIQTAQATYQLEASSLRGTVSQVWAATLSGSGPHTIKLRGQLSTAGGTSVMNQTHTTITVMVNDF
jgi:hypothetical protein